MREFLFLILLVMFSFNPVLADEKEKESLKNVAAEKTAKVIEHPLTWSVNSIRIVWEIGMEMDDILLREYSSSRSFSDRKKSNERLDTVDKLWERTSYDNKNTSAGGNFSLNPFTGFGVDLGGKYSTNGGWLDLRSSYSFDVQEWSESERKIFTAVSKKDKAHRTTTQRFNRKLLFTIDFVNHSDEVLAIDAERRTPTVPVYCGETHLGDAQPINPEFSIPGDDKPYPCQFQLSLAESGIEELLKNVPEICVEKAQLLICGKTIKDAIRKGPHFTVRLISETENLFWEITTAQESPTLLTAALRAVNDICEKAPFEFAEDGSLAAAAGIPSVPTKDSAGFLLITRNGELVKDLYFAPERNDEIEFFLISRKTLENIQPEPLTMLIPYREFFQKWANDGFLDEKYLAINVPKNEKERADILSQDEYCVTFPIGELTLKEAYERTPSQGSLKFKSGVYEIPETLVIEKDMRIIGAPEQPENVVLKGGMSSVFHIRSGTVEINGITFQNDGDSLSQLKEKSKNLSEERRKRQLYNSECSAVRFSALSGILKNCVFISLKGCGLSIDSKDSSPAVIACTARNCGGPGIRLLNGASARFTDCQSSGNKMPGIQISGSGTNPIVEKCRFIDGHSYGIFVLGGAGGIFIECESSGNKFAGLAVSDSGTAPRVEKCRFKNGKHRGVEIRNGACGIFIDCESTGNTKAGFVVADSESAPKVENCCFFDGKSSGICVYTNAAGSFTNCKVSGNQLAGIVVQGEGTEPVFEMCVITNNKGGGIYVSQSGSGIFRKNTLSGNKLKKEDVNWYILGKTKIIREENIPNM